MKQNNKQDSNDELDTIQKKHQRLLEIYYNNNLSNYANALKKYIPQLDSNYQNKFIRKSDKLWVQTNLTKLLPKNSDKISKVFLSKNLSIKNIIDSYRTDFYSLPQQLLSKIRKNHHHTENELLANRKKSNTFAFRNQSFSQNVSTEPSSTSINVLQTLSSKRVFRVRQLKNNLQQTMIHNSRYEDKFQKIKLQSTLAEFFFQKDINPQQTKTFGLQKNNIDKIKIMTNIRWSFNPSKKSQKVPKLLFQRDHQNLNQYIGFELKKQNYYKPKSKCQDRNNKIFLHF